MLYPKHPRKGRHVMFIVYAKQLRRRQGAGVPRPVECDARTLSKERVQKRNPRFSSFSETTAEKGEILPCGVFPRPSSEKGTQGVCVAHRAVIRAPVSFPSAEKRTRQQCRSVYTFYSGFHSSSEDTSAMLQSSFGIDHIHLVPTFRDTMPAIFFLASFTVRREICFLAAA